MLFHSAQWFQSMKEEHGRTMVKTTLTLPVARRVAEPPTDAPVCEVRVPSGSRQAQGEQLTAAGMV